MTELPTSNQGVATVYRTGILVSPDGWQSEEREWVDADEYRFLRRRYDESVNHQQELNTTYERDVDQLHAEIERLRAALTFYADPETYFAIGFFPDPPCGAFMEDFSDTGPTYWQRPGKRAREALKASQCSVTCCESTRDESRSERER